MFIVCITDNGDNWFESINMFQVRTWYCGRTLIWLNTAFSRKVINLCWNLWKFNILEVVCGSRSQLLIVGRSVQINVIITKLLGDRTKMSSLIWARMSSGRTLIRREKGLLMGVWINSFYTSCYWRRLLKSHLVVVLLATLFFF